MADSLRGLKRPLDLRGGSLGFCFPFARDNKTAFNPVLLDDSITLSNEIIKRVPSQFSDIFRATVLKQLYGKKVSNNLNSLIPKDGKSLLGLDLKATEIKKRDKLKPIPIFVKDVEMAKKLAVIDKDQEEFLKAIWPGRITAVLERKKNCNLAENLFGKKKTLQNIRKIKR